MASVDCGRKCGRHRDGGKRQRILEVATSRFLTDGYHRTTIEGIALAASVSKVTVYNHFTDKDRLLAAAVDNECARIRQRIKLSDDYSSPIRTRLEKIGTDIVAFLLTPEMRHFEQRIAAETETYPDVGSSFLEAGPRRLLAQLASILDGMNRRGEISAQDPALAAERFVAMCKGTGDLKPRFGYRETSKEAHDRISGAVEVFLAAYFAPG